MSFDILAPHYRWMEFFLAGEKLQRCRMAFLDRLPPARNILLLGEGNGRFLPACIDKFASAQITCVDASLGMITQAQKNLSRRKILHHSVNFIHADALNWVPPANHYDLIVTNFFLDCFRPEELQPLVHKISQAATRDSNWLIADFQTADSGARRVRSRLILAFMYRFFRIVTRLPACNLTPPDELLEQSRFRLRDRRQSEWGLLRSDWWQRV